MQPPHRRPGEYSARHAEDDQDLPMHDAGRIAAVRVSDCVLQPLGVAFDCGDPIEVVTTMPDGDASFADVIDQSA